MNKIKKDSQTEFVKQVNKYKHLLERYEKYSNILQQVLEKAASKYAPLSITRVRTKSISSFAEKIQRKKDEIKDPVNEFTDLCGGRVITTTPSEVEAVCKFIEDHFNIDWGNSIDVSQRHKPSEFGYRSVHYIVTFREGVFPTKDVNVSIPKKIFPDKNSPMKAEIQVRTLLEHAWAVFAHDRTYKSSFRIPDKWQRELASVAALLEDADKTFERIHTGLHTYASSYKGYMSEEQIRDEVGKLRFILTYDPENSELAARIGHLAITIGEWDTAIEVLSGYAPFGHPSVLKSLGIALCKKHLKNPDCQAYKKGQKYIEASIQANRNDADAISSLAGTWKALDEEKSRELYRQAFGIDPADPYPLENYLTLDILKKKDVSIIPIMAPVIGTSIKRCLEQIEVGVNIPWAYYSMGMFYLLLQKPYDSLSAYARGIQLSTAAFMIETSLASLNKLSIVKDELPGYEWVRRLHLIGGAARFQDGNAIQGLEKLKKNEKIKGPVVIVAGGCDQSVEKMIRSYKDLLIEAFSGFTGTIISGGTTQGISGLVGDLRERYSDAIHTIGYLPQMIPADATVDKDSRRYKEIRYTEGSGFTPLEPLQNWIDLICSEINPSQVKVLGINGGRIASIEYKIALALGAKVALIEESGREASKLLTDAEWKTAEGLIEIPADAQTVRAFIGTGLTKLDPRVRVNVAKAFHEHYREIQKSESAQKEPSMAEWKNLKTNLKESNLLAADHIFEKLRKIRCEAHEVKDKKINILKFTEKEIETLAEMEHGRWNAERLMDGWRWGEKKDVEKKISPYLVGWKKLPEHIKKWDREMVGKIPEILAGIGFEVRRIRRGK